MILQGFVPAIAGVVNIADLVVTDSQRIFPIRDRRASFLEAGLPNIKTVLKRGLRFLELPAAKRRTPDFLMHIGAEVFQFRIIGRLLRLSIDPSCRRAVSYGSKVGGR